MDGIIPELRPVLSRYDRPVVCFSGGLDSTVLLRNAIEFCENPVALFVRLPMNTARQLEAAIRIAVHLDAELRFETLSWNDLKGIENNGPDRCYLCKRAIFSKALDVAEDYGNVVFAGDNADDRDDKRPGHRASRELGIVNPLREAGIGRGRVKAAISEMGLPVVMIKDTCMATRYPVGYPIGEREMRFAEECESAVRKVSGLKQLRIRYNGKDCMVTTDRSEMDEMVRHITQITYELKSRGLQCDFDPKEYEE